MFGAGTACVVCPVNRILYEGQVGEQEKHLKFELQHK